MQAVIPFIVEMGKFLWNPVKERVDYLIHFDNNVEDLKDRLEDLVAKRSDIERLVCTGHEGVEEQTEEVTLWLKRSIDIEEAAKQIDHRHEENKKWLCCPNLCWRYSISKRAKETADLITKHNNEWKLGRVSLKQIPPAVVSQQAPSVEYLPSVESTLSKVMNALVDENIKIIGVWGMAGVGKTTLVKNVNNRLRGTQQFNKVIMVTISKDTDVKRVQGDIADRLGLNLKREALRAVDISSKLIQERTFLVILDDLWERLELTDVGIPSDLVGCKIILTTRREAVCRKMETNVNFKVDVLSNGESWKLFKEKTGNVVDDDTIHVRARELFKECGGLPLAIITLGRALRGVRNPQVWDNALCQMKKSAPGDIEDMEANVYQSIKLSYDQLRPGLKAAFLFCCMFPEDDNINVGTMITYWKGEGFLEDAGSLEETTNKGQSWIEELISSCLLLEGYQEGFVKMHDIIRDVAIYIASKEDGGCKSLARARLGWRGLPQSQKWEEYKRISLMSSGINELPEGMHCPRLLTLLMQGNMELREIPGWFLAKADALRVLDLSYTAISKLPSSLSNLENLRVLRLQCCRFVSRDCLSLLGRLKQLETLDLSFNIMLRELPTEIGELINLRSLDLTETFNLSIIPHGVISRLSRLEELKMLNSFSNWEVEGGAMYAENRSSSSSSNATLYEVESLKQLSYLHIQFSDYSPQDYKHYATLKEFRFCIRQSRYEFYSADIVSHIFSSDSSRAMEIIGFSAVPQWVRVLLPQATYVELTNCQGLRTLGGGEGFPSLKHLQLQSCQDSEYVISVEENTLHNLQDLKLFSMQNIEKIVSEDDAGLLPPAFLSKLRNVHVSSCPMLKHVLPSSFLPRMDNLTIVEVENCEELEHVFREPPTMVLQQEHVLCNIQALYLRDLRYMRSIWSAGLVVTLQNLTMLSINGCHGLKKSVLSSIEMKGGLPNLMELRVFNCQGVEEIISEVVENEGLLPKLRALRLQNLPQLVRIWGRKVQGGEVAAPLQLDWCSLKKMHVWRCPKLQKLQPLQGGANGAPLLQEITGETEWWERLDWDGDDTIKAYFQPKFTDFEFGFEQFRRAMQTGLAPPFSVEQELAWLGSIQP